MYIYVNRFTHKIYLDWCGMPCLFSWANRSMKDKQHPLHPAPGTHASLPHPYLRWPYPKRNEEKEKRIYIYRERERERGRERGRYRQREKEREREIEIESRRKRETYRGRAGARKVNRETDIHFKMPLRLKNPSSQKHIYSEHRCSCWQSQHGGHHKHTFCSQALLVVQFLRFESHDINWNMGSIT